MPKPSIPRVLKTSLAGGLAIGLLAFGAMACSEDETATPNPSTPVATATTTASATPSGTPSGEPGTSDYTLRGGVNDPEDVNIAVLAYLPAAITVPTGSTVKWDITGPEPHSVTFPTASQPLPSPEDPSLPMFFAPTPPTKPYDGTEFVNSGLGPLGPDPFSFEMEFGAAGTYAYVCVIHPAMTGTVVVVDDAAGADTQEAVTARGDAELEPLLEEGRAAKAALLAMPPTSTANGDGTTTWTVEMGITTPHTDVLAFQPVNVEVKAGDTVTFVNNSGAPHTATFAGGQPVPPPGTPGEEVPTGPSPITLDATVFASSGYVPPDAPPGGGPPLEVRQFSFVVPAAGAWEYICVLHIPSGMAGVINAQ